MNVEQQDALLIRAEQAYRDVVADPRQGRPTAEDIARRAREAKSAEALSVALRAAGWAARELYDHDAAQRHLNEAVRVARRERLHDRLCEALITRSAMYLEMGQAGRARRDLDTAAGWASARSRAEVAFARGLMEDIVGNLDGAVDAYQRVLRTSDNDRLDLRFKALNNLGLVVLRLGRYRDAERRLADAAALAETFSPAFSGFVAESQATLAIERGRPVEALRRYERAEELLSAVGVQLADLYIGKANALLRLRLLEEAAAAADLAVRQVAGRVGGSLMLAEALLPKARIALARGLADEAAQAAGRSEDLFRRQRRSGWQAHAALLSLQAEWQGGTATAAMADRLARIERTMRRVGNVPAVAEAALLHGQVAAALGHPRRAVAALERATAAARGPVLLRLQGRLAAALKADLVGDSRRVSRVCRVGLEEVSAYRATFASAELRARAAAHGAALADLALRTAVRSGRAEHVWSWLERARAVVTVRAASHDTDDVLRPQLAQLRGLERDLREASPEDARTQAALLHKIARLEHRIRDRTRTRRALDATVITPSLAALRALRTDLGDRLLLQYGVVEGRIVGVAVTPKQLRLADIGPVGPVKTAGHQLAFALRRLSQPRSGAAVAAALDSARRDLEQLGTQLTSPFTDALASLSEVIVAPPANLIGIPWSALPPLAHGPVRVVPSATMWQLTHQRAASSDRVVLVAGPGLPSAESEVAQIGRCYPNAHRLVGDAATSEAVRSAACGARLVHIACHGRLRTDSAAFSSLRLSDGPLTVHDLERLPQTAHHWVLAACDMGNPGQLAASELDGVLATLLHGGAGGVVAAVVCVPDMETCDFMTALHQELAGGASLADATYRARTLVDATEPKGFVASVAFSCYGGG
jgi:CHAT domain-containing protein/tetratricopeptide (TPR) repeat protein